MSGRLNPRMGGPGMYPTLPDAVLEGQSRPGDGWGKSDELEQCRRSIYIFAKRSLAVPELELLDAPDNTSSCERRIVSTTGPQALTFLNGAFIHEQAGHFAARLVARGRRRSRRAGGASVRAGAGPASRGRRVARRARVPRQARAADRARPRRHAKAEPGSAARPARPERSRRCAWSILNMNEFVYIN